MFLGYEILFFNTFKEKKTYLEIGKIILMTIFCVVLYFIILNLITFIRTGNIIGIKNSIYGQATFLGSGFYMLRMPLWHPWLLLVLIYGIALVKSILNLKFMKENNDSKYYEKSSIIFSLAILGMGIFSYYQGRSHNQVFMYITYPGIILISIFLDYLITNYSIYKYNKLTKFYKITIIMIGITTLTVFSTTTIYHLFANYQMFNKKHVYETNVMTEDLHMAGKIKDIVQEIDFVLPYESYYYINLGIADRKNFPSYVDLFKYEDCKRIIDYMRENEKTLCTDETIYKILNTRYKEELDNVMQDKYKIVEVKEFFIFVSKENWENINQLENIK